LADDLRRWLSDQTIKAKPPGVRQRAVKWARRHRAVVASAVALLVLAVVGFAASTVQIAREQRHTQEAYEKLEEAYGQVKSAYAEAARGKRQALQALGFVSDRAITYWLAERAKLTPHQKQFLELVLKSYEEITAEAGDDEETRAEVAAAWRRVAGIRGRLGQVEAGADAFDQSVRLYERLAADFPRKPAYQFSLAQCYAEPVNRPESNAGRRSDRARQNSRRSLSLLERLSADDPGTAAYRFWLAFVLTESAKLLPDAEQEPTLRRAVALAERLVTDDSATDHRRRLGKALIPLGTHLIARRREMEAKPLLLRAVDVLETVLADDPDEHSCLRALAGGYESLRSLLGDQGSYAEAERAGRRALALREKLAADVSSERPGLLTAQTSLAAILKKAGRPVEAGQLYLQALASLQLLFADIQSGAVPPDNVWWLFRNAGRELRGAGRLAEAEQCFRWAVAALEKTAAERPDELGYMIQLAAAYRDAGRLQDSITLHEQALPRMMARQGPDHHLLVGGVHNLAHAYQDAGRLPEAVVLFEQSLEKMKAFPEPDANETRKYMSCLAAAYQSAGKYDRAEPLLIDLLEFHRKMDGPKSPATAGVLANLGLNRLKQHKFAEAEKVLRECLTIRDEKQPDGWLRFSAMSLLGGALLGQEKYAEAEPLLLQGYEGMTQRAATIPPAGKKRLTEAIERIVRLYEAIGQTEKVRAWREKRPAGERPGD
jgi:tetratricopeptide (TPR) repeat protein